MAKLDVPLGRIEFLGQVLHLVEHEGRLIAACTGESGRVAAALTAPRITAADCRRLMRQAIDLLFDSAEGELKSRSTPTAIERSQLLTPNS